MIEAPLPYSNNLNIPKNKENEHILCLNGLVFNIKIEKITKKSKELLNFIIIELNSITDIFYQSSFSLKNLKKLTKLYKIFDSINEAYNELNKAFIEQKVYLQDDINGIIIHFTLSNISSKIEEITLKIKKQYLSTNNGSAHIQNKKIKIQNKNKSKDKDNLRLVKIVFLLSTLIICYLFYQINQLKIYISNHNQLNLLKKIDLLEQNFQAVKEENIKLKKILEELIIWKQNNENKYNNSQKIEKLNNQITNKRNWRIDSKIITKKKEIKFLSKRLRKDNNNKKVKFNLIYRATKDGEKNYHNKCDGKINTLIVIHTIKGIKFGGYTETMINSNNKDYIDKNSFIFSLDKMKIYENKDYDIISHYEKFGPIFKGAFFIGEYFLNVSNKIINKLSSKYIMDNNYEINNGEDNFNIKELEVFQIFLE